MLIPSIDIQGGETVQLVGGEERALSAGPPAHMAEVFGCLGPIAVIDLDAAMGAGSNRDIIAAMCKDWRCRVGGGIRDLETARWWLDAGAEQIIIGTAATPELLRELPRERVIVALDARMDEVVVEGWKTGTGARIEERMEALREFVSGFLVTFVENEGRMGGTRMDRVPALVETAGERVQLTIAGGVATAGEIAELDRMGADAQVGMALYTGALDLIDAWTAPLTTDRTDGLWPTVVTDEFDRALGLCYSNPESLREAIASRKGVYWSRKRGLWRKGESSGNEQELLGIGMDCDRDTLRFRVRQTGSGFCHLAQSSCWGPLEGLPELETLLRSRMQDAPEGSYTRRLFSDTALLAAKLREEADELLDADTPAAHEWEFADLLYFSLVKLAQGGGHLNSVVRELNRRGRKVTRRPGNAKN